MRANTQDLAARTEAVKLASVGGPEHSTQLASNKRIAMLNSASPARTGGRNVLVRLVSAFLRS